VKLYVLTRNQFENRALRKFFKEKYGVDVGLYSYGCFDPWRMPGPMVVGRYCSISGSVRSLLSNHPIDALTTHPALYDKSLGVIDESIHLNNRLAIEDDVWIGHNATILAGCRKIGRGAVIGAGSVVTRDVAPYTVVAGNPAQKLKDRFAPDLVAAIEASGWWEWDLAELRSKMALDREAIYHPTASNLMKLAQDGS
jgi:acetyltransferase-like isoleucine patch superfamily enzyme